MHTKKKKKILEVDCETSKVSEEKLIIFLYNGNVQEEKLFCIFDINSPKMEYFNINLTNTCESLCLKLQNADERNQKRPK